MKFVQFPESRMPYDSYIIFKASDLVTSYGEEAPGRGRWISNDHW